MNRRHIAALGISLTAAAAVGASLSRGGDGQPIDFSHRLHVEELGIACPDCHRYVMEEARATIPNIDVCRECHEEPLTDSAAEVRLVDFIQQGKLIPWRKVYWVPDHVYFSHRRHTSIAGIACEVCHGEIGSREAPLTRPEIEPGMDHCMDCHQRSQASNDCLVCHR